MPDISTVWPVGATSNDWAVAGGALQDGNDLATAVLISLYTERQANTDDVVQNGDRRGWWGDPTMGSRLWLLARAKHTDENARLAEEYAQEALAWMIDDGVAAAVTTAADWRDRTTLELLVQVLRTDGMTQSLAYSWAWDGLGLVTVKAI